MSGNALLYRQAPSAPATVVAGEAAIVTPDDSRLHVLNGVGTRVWELCEGSGRTIDDIVTTLVAEFRVERDDARVATEAFLRDATSRGILQVHPSDT